MITSWTWSLSRASILDSSPECVYSISCIISTSSSKVIIIFIILPVIIHRASPSEYTTTIPMSWPVIFIFSSILAKVFRISILIQALWESSIISPLEMISIRIFSSSSYTCSQVFVHHSQNCTVDNCWN